jgi:outer membrane protein assembly factor BamB
VRRSLRAFTVGIWVLSSAGLASGARADLLTYGYSNARTGDDTGSYLSVRTAKALRIAWGTRLDGAVTAQPLVVHRVWTAERVRNLVLVVTEHGEVAALDAETGDIVWRRRVSERTISPDCQASPDGRFGVTATPVVDRQAGRVYVADADGWAWALRLGSGRVVPGWPVRVAARPADFIWGALTLARGWLYVPIASMCDSGHYLGGVTALPVGHPTRMVSWYTTAGTQAYGGGVWGWGGVSVDALGHVYVATGNALGQAGEAAGHAESVVQLTARLAFLQANDPLSPPFRTTDRDFGTTPVLVHRPGCPAELVAINKDGELFLYDRLDVSAGPRQRLDVAGDAPGLIPLIGVPAFSASTNTLVLVSPSSPPAASLHPGVLAFRLNAGCELTLDWQQSFDRPDAGSPPTIAGGVVFIGSGRNGWLRAFDLADGSRVNSWHLSRQALFAPPAVDQSTVYAATWSGRVWALRGRPSPTA